MYLFEVYMDNEMEGSCRAFDIALFVAENKEKAIARAKVRCGDSYSYFEAHKIEELDGYKIKLIKC